MIITADNLKRIAPQAVVSLTVSLAVELTKTLPIFHIDTPLRISHFLGQAALESGGYRTLVEYSNGEEYEGRVDLGNTQAGDGSKYKGRGIFQITGRANYTQMSKIIGIDLVGTPEWAADPAVSVRTACEFWQTRNLSVLADADDIRGITKKINGGYNGIEDRVIFVRRAKGIFLIGIKS